MPKTKRVIGRSKPRAEEAAENMPIVTILRVECDSKFWEQDMYCPKCKLYHTKHYKQSESEPAIVPTGVPAKDLLMFSYIDTPENYEDRVITRNVRRIWQT